MEGAPLVPTVALCLGSKCALAEPEDNFATVHVSARAFVEFSVEGQPGSIPSHRPWAGAQVELEAIPWVTIQTLMGMLRATFSFERKIHRRIEGPADAPLHPRAGESR